MTDISYWPDLKTLPSGWRLFRIEWSCGRATADLHRNDDNAMARSGGNHRTPASAFNAACEIARKMP
jgi:hypothetical protein